MNVLYFSSRGCWPPTSGARLRDYHLAHELALHSSLTFVGLRGPGDPESPPPGDAGFARYIAFPKPRGYTPGKLLRGLLGPIPVTVLNYSSARITAALETVLAEGCFDVVQVEGVHLLKYLPVIRRAHSRPVVVADWHNIESELMHRYADKSHSLPRKLVAWRTAVLLERAEAMLIRACDAHVVVSDRERTALLDRFPEAVIHVVGNGVDAAAYAEEARANASEQRLAARPTRPGILFVGSMDYHANVDAVTWFARYVWPELRRKEPSLSFTIAGRNPSPEVRALAGEGIFVTGTVDDLRPFYRDASVVVVPLRVGGGTRLKILEAMAAGVPVVSTRLGAEGLEVEDGLTILIADTPGQISDCIQDVLSSPKIRGQLAGTGRELVLHRYDWSHLGERLFDILQSAVTGAAVRNAAPD